ncbi:MAG: nucleotide sugar dehydrogenase [Luteitalea sp.]|nr:nucleotide sugar dehydrogenase [Luteitalea sp.]
MSDVLIEKLRARQAHAGVIGLGYVGLPLAVAFARAGLQVTGFDLESSKVAMLNAGESYILDVPNCHVSQAVGEGRFQATTDVSALSAVDTINICVPTPLRKTKDPDLSFIVAAVTETAKYLRRGQLVILESTTYPGTTEEVVQPMLEAGGLKAGVDFYLAFSPERVDPGNPHFQTHNIPKVVGGVDPASTEAAVALYSTIVTDVVPVSSTRVAEMVKLLENTFRAVNIGLVNELALMCRDLGINVWEVIDAAKTKPFGFMPFYPGPGLGGHCIPIDPFYLSWKARETGFESRFIELAGHVNASMPKHVVSLVADALNSIGRAINGSRIHLFGMAYKPDVSDHRESPALDIARLLRQRGARVTYSDPHVRDVEHGDFQMAAVPLEEAYRNGFECAIVTTNHRAFDYAELARRAPLIVDTRNALKGVVGDHIFRL